MLTRRACLQSMFGGLAVLRASAAPVQRPNVLVIVSDDQGYGDISAYPHPREVRTPHMDRLAQRGIRFEQGYANAYVCAPSRAAILTGTYPQRYGFYTASDSRVGLPLSQVTLADVLKKEGYTTCALGKWHLGIEPAYHPMKRGFDEFYGFLGHGGHDYFDLKRTGETYNSILRNYEPIDETGYLTDNLGREAVTFIARKEKKPFFLYLAFNAVHAPMQALSVGSYDLRVEHAGFQSQVQRGIVLTTGQALELSFALRIGDVKDSIAVTSDAPLLETRTSDSSQLIESKTIEDIPLGDRRALNLMEIQGGSVFVAYQSGERPYFSVGGGRSRSQNFVMDCGSAQTIRLGQAQVEVDPPVETLLDVANFYSPWVDGEKQRARIRRNKAFYFAGYEGAWRLDGRTAAMTVPSVFERGDFSQSYNANGTLALVYDPSSGTPATRPAFPVNRIPAARFDPVALNVLKSSLNDRIRIQFRGEAFNVLNNAVFGLPGQVLGNADFGIVNSAAAPRQIQLAARLVF